MREVNVTLDSSSEDALRRGLEEHGIDLNSISDGFLSGLLSHALGYVDYTDPSIIQDLLENA